MLTATGNRLSRDAGSPPQQGSGDPQCIQRYRGGDQDSQYPCQLVLCCPGLKLPVTLAVTLPRHTVISPPVCPCLAFWHHRL